MAGAADNRQGRLAIIAGGGRLPHDVAEAARLAGENPFILRLSGESNQDWSGFDQAELYIGDMVRFASLLKDNNLKRVVLSGAVRQRPDFRRLRPTFSTVLKLPSIIRTLLSGGDDTVLRMAIEMLEGAGCRVVGAHEIVPDLLSKVGPLGAVQPGDEDRKNIAAGMAAADALGALDVGQGAVAIGGRVVALEGAEGTDSMMERVASLRALGRVSFRRKGVLVKMCKPQQDMRADLPTIGLSTIENAAKAGLAGVAVEAGRSLVLERNAVIDAANAAGLFVVGLDRGLPGGMAE